MPQQWINKENSSLGIEKPYFSSISLFIARFLQHHNRKNYICKVILYLKKEGPSWYTVYFVRNVNILYAFDNKVGHKYVVSET